MMTSFERQVLGRRDTPPAATEAVTAIVTRSDATGVWAVPIGADTAHPIGPCRGAWRTSTTPQNLPVNGGQGGTVASHQHGRERLPTGTVVLLLNSAAGPWILRED